MNTTPPLPSALGIAAVERDTGIAKDTLRVWERRYGFPAPIRDENGERVYPPEQVDKLRLIRRLLDQGRRPSRIIAASAAELSVMLEGSLAEEGRHAPPEHWNELLAALRHQDGVAVHSALQQLLLKQGLQQFVTRSLAPLADAVGQAWLRGELGVSGEHLFTEQVQNVVRAAIGARSAGGAPRILLTTPPNELHALGLLMAEAMLAPEGVHCISLGTQTPVPDILAAALAGRVDIVALSFSAAYPARQAMDVLHALRAALPPPVSLWAGGTAVREHQRKLPEIRVIANLEDCLTALAEWRAASSPPATHAPR